MAAPQAAPWLRPRRNSALDRSPRVIPLAARDVYRTRAAQRGILLGVLALAFLAAVVVLWSADWVHELWKPLVVASFCASVAGTVSSVVGLRAGVARAQALRGLLVSAVALTFALFVQFLLYPDI
jgi:hypothetical protein